MITKEITELEEELLEAIRNYKRAYPNGDKKLLEYVKEVLEQLLEED